MTVRLHDGLIDAACAIWAFVAPLLQTSDETAEGREKSNEELMKLNVIVVYKKLVQGLIYSPPDCDKYLALDASTQV